MPHDHIPPADLGPAFRWAVWLNVSYVIVEAIAGFLTGSLALLADAFIDHVTDELKHDFGIGHVTLQLEAAPCERAGACLATLRK